ncbi:putative 2-phosphoglycolate phosphatase [Paratrimastix pyriformis]|uniref:2-phosphoglycolate phosphatase n=1 Tax=Paratrimastix pyriformis TaxID=342808 RepID=A0ABQ8U981_9EUKA|nr:putative 2-phosphoglycolate phosphatase [Paratrimastix pyriformis]|eukprot:GAFH01003303.1.p1 GENE.GAFH01003303.1~~GAFH01003303.1.p1  ORF type:complete len:311 (-),score=71.95 GAFH01003303.1:3-935(-)
MATVNAHPGCTPSAELAELARRFDVWMFDCDGVLWNEDVVVPGAADFIAHLHRLGKRTFFVTNNATKTRKMYVSKFASFGIEASEEDIIGSGWATGRYLTSLGKTDPHPPRNILVVGEAPLVEELRAVGLNVVGGSEEPRESFVSTKTPPDQVDAVVVGLDRGFNFARLARAQRAILGGARFIATNTDHSLPTLPYHTPGAGSLVAAVATATDREPTVIGKPSRHMFEPILEMLLPGHAAASPAQRAAFLSKCIMVGDRLQTDIAFAHQAGVASVLVLTGISTAQDGRQAPEEMRPTYIAHSVAALVPTN